MTAPVKVRYTHDAMIDVIIAEPTISQNQLAAMFQYSVGWVSQIMTSDAFLARLEARRSEIVDPVLTASLQEKLKAAASRSLDLVMEKLEVPGNHSMADILKVTEVATKALGYGARSVPEAGGTNVQVVVNVPGKMDEKAWVSAHTIPQQLTSL